MKKIKFIFNNLDVIIVSFISTAFFSLIIFDVNSWYYSAIGDEYAFFNFARDIALGNIHLSFFPETGKTSIFSQKGVYEVVPVINSAFQSLVMKVFGTDHQGWITSSIVIVILSLWFFYFLIKDFFGRATAIVSSIIFISSHYLWAFTHLGYWNIQVFFSPLAAFFFFFRGIKTRKILLLFLAGIFSGLGFYTYMSSYITILLLSIFIFFNFKHFQRHKNLIAAFFTGFITPIIPYFLVNNGLAGSEMLRRSVFGSQEIPNNERLVYFFKNLYGSFIAFYQNSKTSHFVSGSLVDSVTAIFFSLGLIHMVISLKKFYFVLTCFTAALIIAGGFSQYTYTPITRLLFLLPITSFIAAFALIQVNTFLIRKLSFLDYKLFPAIIIFIILVLNINRFYYQTPLKIDMTPEALAIKALTTSCKNSLSSTVIGNTVPLLTPALNSYKLNISLMSYNSASSFFNFQNTDCLILMRPQYQELSHYKKQAAYFGYIYEEVTDKAGNREVILFKR